jgi:hypothetical protein
MKSWRMMPRVSRLKRIEDRIHLAENSTISYNVSRWYRMDGVGKVKKDYQDPICCCIASARKEM